MVEKQRGRHRQNAHTAHGDAQKQALIEAAFQVIAEGGFENLRTREVAARAGVNISTLHYYFATKENLVRGVAHYLYHEFTVTEDTRPYTGAMNMRAEIRQQLTDIQHLLQTRPQLWNVFVEIILRSQRDTAIKAILDDLQTQSQKELEGFLTEAAAQGLLRPGVDIPALALCWTTLIYGSYMVMMGDPEHFPTEAVIAQLEHWVSSDSATPD